MKQEFKKSFSSNEPSLISLKTQKSSICKPFVPILKKIHLPELCPIKY